MANLNRVDVPIAVEHKTPLDLSCDHVSTTSFMRLQPVFYRHMMKTEHLSVNANSVVRPAPIEVPFFGSCVQNLRGFFVPYRLVFPQWDSFYNDVIGSNYNNSSLVASPPVLPVKSLYNLFFDSSFGCTRVALVTETPDFTTGGVDFKLTLKGRYYLTIIESLGYKLILNSKDSGNYNALALLALAKVYLDWYTNSQYLNTAEVLLIERLLAFNDPAAQLSLIEPDLDAILGLIVTCVYDTDDYYVNAWDNPVSPNSGQFTGFAFTDPTTTNGAFVYTNTLGSPEMAIGTTTQLIGTTYIHDALKRLTDFQKRHALAGARSIDRVLAQYGIVTDSLKQSRSIYVGAQKVAVETGSVMSTAAGADGAGVTSTVGDYAGAGFGKSSGNFDFTSDEEGIFVIVQTIIPNGSMVQGYDRINTVLDKLSFFQPEFDSLGVAAIEKGEVFVPDTDTMTGVSLANLQGVFGFTGRYGHLKRPKSFLTGDVRLLSHYAGGDSWHLFRLFDPNSFLDSTNTPNTSAIVHSLSFTRGGDSDQYRRVFQYRGTEFDPFILFMHFDVKSYAPCKPLFETYEFESESKKVPTENGNKMN